MEIKGTIKQVFEKVSGTSANGSWEKQGYILTTADQYPKDICFGIFGADKIASADIRQGDNVTVSININSREYNGRWYTQIDAWKVQKNNSPEFSHAPQVAQTPSQQPQPKTDDLPF